MQGATAILTVVSLHLRNTSTNTGSWCVMWARWASVIRPVWQRNTLNSCRCSWVPANVDWRAWTTVGIRHRI